MTDSILCINSFPLVKNIILYNEHQLLKCWFNEAFLNIWRIVGAVQSPLSWPYLSMLVFGLLWCPCLFLSSVLSLLIVWCVSFYWCVAKFNLLKTMKFSSFNGNIVSYKWYPQCLRCWAEKNIHLHVFHMHLAVLGKWRLLLMGQEKLTIFHILLFKGPFTNTFVYFCRKIQIIERILIFSVAHSYIIISYLT